ncbi:MAG: serine protease [Longimicrobiaceae bacterium]
MKSGTARDLYETYAAAMAFVAVRHPDGSEGIGSAFHVGEGVFVTAKHVVEGKTIEKVGTFASTYIRLEGEEAEQALITLNTGTEEYKAHRVWPAVLDVVRGPFSHPDPNIDVAVFQVAEVDPYLPIVLLGDHLDDWMGLEDFVLTEVVIFGFPPIPFAQGPHLVAARGEVNARVDLRHAEHVHFLVSAMPRGGFSGGLVVAENGLALGVVTQSLVMDYQPEQLGYMAVLTIEPIYVCLAEHKMLPEIQSVPWDDFWNTESIWFAERSSDGFGEVIVASIDYCDDGRKRYIEVRCKHAGDRDQAVAAAEQVLARHAPVKVAVEREGIRLTLPASDPEAEEAAGLAVNAAAAVLDRMGYSRSGTLPEEDLIF